MNDDVKGNITTTIKFLVMIVAPYLSISEATQSQIVAITVAIIGAILAYWDAKYPNTKINSNDEPPQTTIDTDIEEETDDFKVDEDGA